MGSLSNLHWHVFWMILVAFLTFQHGSSTNIEVTSAANCPCSDPKWCEPITDVSRKEVFVFSIQNNEEHWQLFDWSRLTTIVMFGYINDTLMCLAHSNNVRTVMLGNVDKATFTDTTKRQQWIIQQFQTVKNHFLDGLNFDFEDAITADDKTVRDSYTALVKETKSYFQKELPYSQISVDVAWKPNTDVRYYDYEGLAESADILFVMAYDEQSQIFGECLAMPNSAAWAANEGIQAYLKGYKISPDKLVLGVPWYGYFYPCIHVVGEKCDIQEVPFRGVNCSDAAGRQYDYKVIYTLIESMPQNYRWNSTSSTPYFMFLDTNKNITYQVQYDDPKSLKIKYDLAAELGLRGVGMWNIDALDYTDTAVGKLIRDSMFGILPQRESSKVPAIKKTNSACPCSDPKQCELFKTITKKEQASPNQSHQINFDQPSSLKLDYDLAASKELRANDMWDTGSLGYSDTQSGQAIIEALPSLMFLSMNIDSQDTPDAATGSTHAKPLVQMSTNSKYAFTPNTASCPCSDPKLCEPIKDTKRKEVYAFSIKNNENEWQKFDWTKLTTVCMFNYVNTNLMCLAHSHNVRAVVLGAVNEITMITPALRKRWISTQLQIVKDNFLDGLNFDVEMGISPKQKDLRDAYTALVNETAAVFRSSLPYSQISVDVIVNAFSTYRAYDYPKLAAAADFLFIMAYDEYGFNHVGPNTDYLITSTGIDSFFKKGISPEKLVLGLPWYGYVYNCVKLERDTCLLNTSLDPSKHQATTNSYNTIYQIMKTNPGQSGWNSKGSSPYYSYIDKSTQKAHQIQYDDPKSLKLKYDLAALKGLKGVGIWTVDYLDYSDSEEGKAMRKSMFDPLPSRSTVTSSSVQQVLSKNTNITPASASAKCPCSDPKMCEAIKDTGRKEVYAFSIENNETHWEKFDWSKITTICMYKYINTSLMCLAHSHNVRAVTLGEVNAFTFINPWLRKSWIAKQLQIVKDNFLDGLNFDYEGEIGKYDWILRDAYIDLVNETNQAFKKELPYSQISVDIVFSPYVHGRDYDYQKLSQAADFLFIMAYDEKYSISGPNVAGPNSGYLATKQGIDSYMHDFQISGDRLVLGLPWYGKIYQCSGLVQDLCLLGLTVDSVCKAGKDGDYILYYDVYNILLDIPDHYRWNYTSSTPYLTFKSSPSNETCQIQFDDPRSLKLKYDLAAIKGLRGVGIWTIDYVDYSDTEVAKEMRKFMFNTLP